MKDFQGEMKIQQLKHQKAQSKMKFNHSIFFLGNFLIKFFDSLTLLLN